MESFDAGMLLLRLVLGGVIVLHGANKIGGPGGLEGTARWFGGIGLRRSTFQARMAAGTEVLCGAALAAGVATPVACAAVVGLMVVAIVTVHGRNGFFIFRPGGGWEYCFVLAAAAIATAVLGPGSVSVDAVLDFSPSATVSALVAVGGAGMAALHLSVFYRPDSGGRTGEDDR